jgi:maltooligosyltrehalose trehalohydrolase
LSTARVWAPRALRVELVTQRDRTDLQRGRGGWWSAPDAKLDGEYAFALDGGEPMPDPRSAWQPHGIHGFSRVVDHAAFAWSDAGWQPPLLGPGVVYELHVGTFTPEGTFEAAISRLDHLRELGVTHVELMPVAEFPGERGWGYDGVDLYAPHRAYGGPLGLKALVDACHARGLAVLLDVVYNHLGPDGNYLSRFGPYFTDRHTTPWGEAVNLDASGSDEVRRFLCDNARMWLRDYHFDGLRLDAVHAFLDLSARHFLEQLAEEVDALQAELGRKLVLIAESDRNDPRIVRPPEVGGYGLDAQWTDDLHHALHACLTGERTGYYADFGGIGQLAKALRSGFVYDGCVSRYRGRRHGRPATGVPAARFVVCLQNHDQVGNRACGERLGHLIPLAKLKLGAALLLSAPFVPLIFQGEEWGASAPFLYFTDHRDPELGRAVTRGRREEFAAFGWDPQGIPDPQARETFERSKLDWDEAGREPHRELLAWYRALLALRRTTPELRSGRLEEVRVDFDERERWLVLWRGTVATVANLGPDARRVELGVPVEPVLLSDARARAAGGALDLPPDAAAIVRARTRPGEPGERLR